MSKSLEQRILTILSSPKYTPLNKSELSRTLEIPPKDRSRLRANLAVLEEGGTIMRLKKGRYILRASAGNVLTGTIRFDFRGTAHVFPDVTDEANQASGFDLAAYPRILVPPKHTHTALNGDVVAISVEEQKPAPLDSKGNTGSRGGGSRPQRNRDAKRSRGQEATPETGFVGKVVRILQRANLDVVGTYETDGRFFYVKPDDKRLPPTIEVPVLPKDKKLRPRAGDKVIVHIDEWTSQQRDPTGSINQVLGPADQPGMDILSVIYQYHLPTEFPDQVLAEAEAISDVVTEEDLKGREDWRDKPVITIDPFDARDFDDAIHVKAMKDGGWELAVHIADVSHYVTPGSALDKEAIIRGNSVYLVDRVIPMLPEKLSNGICSLNPNVDRLTHLAFMRFDRNGKRIESRFTKSVIRSSCRLSYEEAYEKMQGKGPRDKVTKHLETAWELASLLRKNRFDQGALNMDFPETKIILDKNYVPVELRRIEYDESHQLIEEFMLIANEAVAETTKNKLKPSVYRIHDDPDEEKLLEYRDLARSFGYSVGNLTNRREIQKLLEAVQGKPEEHAVKIGLLKSLKRAAYSADSIGHYGLSKTNYTHFTSPIRRYADLIVHRVLTNIEDEQLGRRATFPKPKREDFIEVAKHISATERNAADAEMDTRKIKETEYFARILHSNEQPVFRARITEVRHMGLFIELTESLVRGLVHRTALPTDDYYFDELRQCYKGRIKENRFTVGDDIEVVVSSVDSDRRQIDFRVSRSEESGGRKPGRRRGKDKGKNKGRGKNRSKEKEKGRGKATVKGKSEAKVKPVSKKSGKSRADERRPRKKKQRSRARTGASQN